MHQYAHDAHMHTHNYTHARTHAHTQHNTHMHARMLARTLARTRSLPLAECPVQEAANQRAHRQQPTAGPAAADAATAQTPFHIKKESEFINIILLIYII